MSTERAQVAWGFAIWWVLASLVGGAVGFAVAGAVLGAVLEAVAAAGGFAMAAAVVMAVAGASLGIAQWLVLRRQVSRAGWWVLASTVGLAVGVLFSVAAGVIYAPITGGVLVWLLRQLAVKEIGPHRPPNNNSLERTGDAAAEARDYGFAGFWRAL